MRKKNQREKECEAGKTGQKEGDTEIERREGTAKRKNEREEGIISKHNWNQFTITFCMLQNQVSRDMK
jgi:hypothetical protein